MKPAISVLTLGVDDLPRAVAFYRDGLGLHFQDPDGHLWEIVFNPGLDALG